MKYTLILLAGLLAGSGCATVTADEKWSGTYEYTAQLGKTAAGTSIIIEHTLRIDPKSNTHACQFKVKGYQADETILCQVKRLDKGITVLFHSYPDGSKRNKYGVAVYEPGAPLFSLRRDEGNLITQWREYTPGEKPMESGKYFERTSP